MNPTIKIEQLQYVISAQMKQIIDEYGLNCYRVTTHNRDNQTYLPVATDIVNNGIVLAKHDTGFTCSYLISYQEKILFVSWNMIAELSHE